MEKDSFLSLGFLPLSVEFRGKPHKTQNMSDTQLTLHNNCKATIIPAGDEIMLPAGVQVELLQNLGGSLTVKYQGILYRIDQAETHNIDPGQLQSFPSESAEIDALTQTPFSEHLLWETLETCFDPEIPINIVDLGLVYDLGYKPTKSGKQEVSVKMTLTAQGCGMGPVIAEDARRKLESLEAVESASVEIVWDPPWTPHMISQKGRLKLGIS
jgi:probable FeS assembly SUF system protein SufT